MAAELMAQARAAGHSAFKVKIGFDGGSDIAVLADIANTLGADENLMADVNQAWSLQDAMTFAPRLML